MSSPKPFQPSRKLQLQELDFHRRLASLDISKLTSEQLSQVKKSLDQIEEMKLIEKARVDFKTFVQLCGPKYLLFSSKGLHDTMCNHYNDLIDGDLKRVTISWPPRHGKSEFSSICLPAWVIGKHPDWKIIQASAGDKLATVFGRKVKGIVDSPMFRKVFPGVSISKDSKANAKFATNHGGDYNAIGTSSDVAGLGADVLICDDIVTEQDAKSGNADAYDAAWTWFLTGPQQRLQPGGRIIIVGTRWSKADPIGRVKRRHKEDPKTSSYLSIDFPVVDDNDESNFPELWSTKEIHKIRADTLPHLWAAQYLQNPTAASGSIVPADLWQKWNKSRKVGFGEIEFIPPNCHLTIMCLDTAYTENKRSNPTACTIFGCFNKEGEDEDIPSACLLYAEKKKMEFSALVRQTKEWIKIWKPDIILIEEKSSGPMLRAELNRCGIMVTPVRPSKNEDKISRLNSVQPVFSSKRVYYLPTFACESVINEVSDFPNGDEDDYTDCTSYTVRYMRTTGLLGTIDDLRNRSENDTDQFSNRGSQYAD